MGKTDIWTIMPSIAGLLFILMSFIPLSMGNSIEYFLSSIAGILLLILGELKTKK